MLNLYVTYFSLPVGDIRITNQFLITRAFHFAQLALYTFKLYSATQCDSGTCLIIRLWLCTMESTSNQKLVVNFNIATCWHNDNYSRPAKSPLTEITTIFNYHYRQEDTHYTVP